MKILLKNQNKSSSIFIIQNLKDIMLKRNSILIKAIMLDNLIRLIIKDKEMDIMYTNQDKYILVVGKKMLQSKEHIYLKMDKHLRDQSKKEKQVLEFITMLMEIFILDIGKMI